MKLANIMQLLETYYPLDKQESYDHCGLQIGHSEDDIQKVLITLNVDETTIDQAIQNGCQLILSHHPFLFHSLREIDLTTKRGQLVEKCILHHINVISYHTCYDNGRMNPMILKSLGFKDVTTHETCPCIGLASFEGHVQDLANIFKSQCHLDFVQYVGDLNVDIKRIGLVAGSGFDFASLALENCDVFICGDVTYSHAMAIIEYPHGGVMVVPHFIESFFKEDIHQLLTKTMPELELLMSQEQDYFTTL